MKDQIRLSLIRMEEAVADKNRIVCNMVREQEMGGWLVDWNEAYAQADARFRAAEAEYLNAVMP